MNGMQELVVGRLRRAPRTGFTLMELLVIMGIIALLIAILIPAVASAKLTAMASVSASNLRQLGAATTEYLNRWDNHLPQMAWDVGGQEVIIAALFGGKKGELPAFGINEVGIARRPLNRYLRPDVWKMDPDDREVEEMEEFRSPLDIGQPNTGFGATDSLYDYLGSSYTLNDHALDGEEFATLIPRNTGSRPGGRMPRIKDTSRTWVLAEHPIYNYQQGGNRGQRWYHGQVKAAMWFLDGHTRAAVPIPPGIVNTTRDYTFLPSPDWFDEP